MKRLLLVFFLTLPAILNAQYDIDAVEKDSVQKDKKINPFTLKERMYVGGDISLRFGTQTYMYLAPFVGCDIKYGLSGGVQTMYQYFRVVYTNGSTASSFDWGLGTFVRWRPPAAQFLLMQTELDFFNTEDAYSVDKRLFVPALMGGLGYAGGDDKYYYQLMLMYDFINHEQNPLLQFIPGVPLYFRAGIVFYLG